ncbi:MAG: LptF/LptG family permease, partial [Pseudomonadota bacterium]
PIVAATKTQYEVRSEQYRSDGRQIFSISEEGLWLRQGSAQGQTVIRAERSNLDGTVFFGVTFISLNPGGLPTERVQAERAELTLDGWALTKAKVWPLEGVENPESEATLADAMTIPSTLTHAQIRDSFASPSALPIWDLPAFIENLNRAGFSARLHRVFLQMSLATPLFLAAMVMIGAGFTMRHTRFGRTGQMVMLALLLGLAVYFLRNFAQILGENGQIPILVAAWFPPVAAILLSLTLLLHLEDG